MDSFTKRQKQIELKYRDILLTGAKSEDYANVYGENHYFFKGERNPMSYSPSLTYLRTRPEPNWPQVFRIGTSQSEIDVALLKSRTRRRIYIRR